MSGDMLTTLMLSEDADTEDIKHKYGRISIYKKLVKCAHDKDCKWRHCIESKETLCNACKHKLLYDIPDLIDKALHEKFDT